MTVTQTEADVQVVPLTMSTAEVRLGGGAGSVSIGKVSMANGRWYWQHRDGEQSSPIADNRSEAATALANYHRAFKPQAPSPGVQPAATRPAGAPVRKLLFA
jgi:hypothetical protein